MDNNALIDETINLNTPLPLEEMYSYVTCVTYAGSKKWYTYIDTTDPYKAAMVTKTLFKHTIGEYFVINRVECKEIMWLEYRNPEPRYTWYEYNDREALLYVC